MVLNANPVPLLPDDCSYRGIYDLCVEALSDSDKDAVERDTKVKKAEYAAGGIKEYFILHHTEERAFFRLNARGVYVPIIPQGGVIHSEVLPGFQFRIADLEARPAEQEMVADPVYREFVQPAWTEDRMRREKAEQRAASEAQRADSAEQRAQAEARARADAEAEAIAAQAEIARLTRLLADREGRR